MKRSLFKRKLNKENKGTTLIEMIVSFTLLSIFVSASVIVIANVTTLYYRVRGENYARQIGDIVTNKIASEVSGAEYSTRNTSSNLYIKNEGDFKSSFTQITDDIDGNTITLYDRTDTKVSIFASDGILKIYYHEINDEINTDNSREAVYWTFDENVYNGYHIEELYFVQAGSSDNQTVAQNFGIEGVDPSDYPSNVLAVYMKINSDRYGQFNICRYVKVYSAPESGWIMTEAGD